MQLRPIQITDWPDILAIQAQCYTELEPESLAVLQNKHLLGADTCLVILHNQRLVGYCLAHPWKEGVSIGLEQLLSPMAEPDCLYLHDIAILPQAQGLGIGKRVLSRLIDAAHGLGLTSLCLVAVQGAQGYWSQQGFSRQDATHSLASYPPGACAMRYRLSQSFGTTAQQ